ncbi:hypothetical protein GIB67_001225 [Kingdonia uniflora]|uniref:WAT1-related protein n=1 Tax=Kingdonia uniflora TaxID=39325 RepID=A0A7J7LGC3_9MAGN|nr:hypothetical protein GIB67_001225 [Kingdonia uniflora]
MLKMLKPDFLEDIVVVTGLIAGQFFFAVYTVFTSYLMTTIGLTPLFLIIYGSFATTLFLLPVSFCFERKTWPKEFSLKLFGQFVMLSFGGYEKVTLKCAFSQVKILGTLVCVVGAVTMSFLHKPITEPVTVNSQLNGAIIDRDKITGTLCLIAGVILMSCIVVLQAATLGDFPAPMSLNAVTAFIGGILTVAVQIIQEGRLDIGSPLVSSQQLAAYALLGGSVTGVCVSFQSWAMKKRGPVFVSTFGPIGTLFAVILSALTLGETITIGSLVGMFLMFSGLYFVLWAKKKESCVIIDPMSPRIVEPRKPLLV